MLLIFRGVVVAIFAGIGWAEWWLWAKVCGWIASWPLLLALLVKGLFVLCVFVPTGVEMGKYALIMASNSARFAAARKAQAAYFREIENSG